MTLNPDNLCYVPMRARNGTIRPVGCMVENFLEIRKTRAKQDTTVSCQNVETGEVFDELLSKCIRGYNNCLMVCNMLNYQESPEYLAAQENNKGYSEGYAKHPVI